MPFKFACEHCDRVLSAGSSKIGRRAKCPGCGERITVPDKEAAAESMKRRKSRSGEPEDADPFAQFMVFDDAELVYETDDFERKVAEQVPVDHDKVAVSRRVVYIQGVLLGAVALLFFVFGFLAGSATDPVSLPRNGPASNETVVFGEVSYKDGQGIEQSDAGAIVILLPHEKIHDERVKPDGLRPGDAPNLQKTARASMGEIGGYFAFADQEGKFKIKLREPNRFFVLCLSGNANLPPGSQRTTEQQKQMVTVDQYIYPTRELFGERQFQLVVAELGRTGPTQLAKVMFE